MSIVITGSQGFIAKNLIFELKNRGYSDVTLIDRNTSEEALDQACQAADFVFHLAGVNRPKDESEFTEGNVNLTASIIDTLKKHHNRCPILMSSSIQAELDNPYGNSKREAETLLFEYSNETGVDVLIYRFPNVFGKWCKPHYNSVVATFCHNLARDLPIQVNDPTTNLKLVYIDDVIEELIKALKGQGTKVGRFYAVSHGFETTLGNIVDKINDFERIRATGFIPNMADDFTKKLYSTYVSYLPKNKLSYPLKTHSDQRGSFTEFMKTADRGQVSVNISKPGSTKGNHWHHTKVEKFLVVSGHGVIRFRRLDEDEVIEYHVSGETLEVVDIPVGYTHNIENLGETDMVTVMWANETFDQTKPDTYYVEV